MLQSAIFPEPPAPTDNPEILDDFYGGKLENFCAALVGNQAIKDDDVDKLYTLIDEWRTK